jgi:1,4-dihydroxy-2-naphthoate octaprenyltransferase
MSLIANWKEIIDTANLSPDKHMDLVSRWLIITRSAVFTMTMTSGLIGGLLALQLSPAINWVRFGLAFVGLVLAHAANNMINDFFDLQSGVDTDEYTRALYAPHPVLAGLISKRGLLTAILIVNAVDAVILAWLALQTGWPVIAFALAGLFISVFYVAPPIKLKHRGLGEPAVFIVWGPLMIGGTYYAAAGTMPPAGVWLACVPYALVVTTVLMGKHIDKIEVDKQKGIHTLPVLMGDSASRALNAGLMVAYYATVVALVLIGDVGAWVLLVFLAVPRLVSVLKTYRAPKPSEPPENYPVWPLWYVSAAFYHNKLAGGLFVLGLILNWAVPSGLHAFGLG